MSREEVRRQNEERINETLSIMIWLDTKIGEIGFQTLLELLGNTYANVITSIPMGASHQWSFKYIY